MKNPAIADGAKCKVVQGATHTTLLAITALDALLYLTQVQFPVDNRSYCLP